MFKYTLSAFCAALMLAAPAYAQSSMVMVIGELPAARLPAQMAPAAGADTEQLVARALKTACPRPFMRDLKAQAAHARCVAQAETEFRSLLAAGTRLAVR